MRHRASFLLIATALFAIEGSFSQASASSAFTAFSSSCESLFKPSKTTSREPFRELMTEPSVPLRFQYPSEARFYKTPDQARNYQIEIQHGVFVSHLAKSPFVTKLSKALIVLSEDGDLFGVAQSRGISHHSTAVAGRPIKFAGEITTDDQGRVLWLSYRSGHYPHEPFRMKLFLEDLETQGVDLSQVRVALDERDVLAGRLDLSSRFFREAVQPDWNGDDVAAHYLIFAKPVDFAFAEELKSKWEITQVMKNINYFASTNPSAIERIVSREKTTSTVVQRLADWVDRYVSLDESTAEHDLGNLLRALKYQVFESDSLRDNGAQLPAQWRLDLRREIKKRHPEL